MEEKFQKSLHAIYSSLPPNKKEKKGNNRSDNTLDLVGGNECPNYGFIQFCDI
jgi:hypothetical protein